MHRLMRQLRPPRQHKGWTEMLTGHFKFINYPISFLAIVTPWWQPVLETISQYSAMLLPAAGLAWLVLQMVLAVLAHRKGKAR